MVNTQSKMQLVAESGATSKLVPHLQPAANFANPNHDHGVDWFHFETRIRKVIYEVVDPLTKKQYQGFDALDEMKRQINGLNFRHDELVGKVDRHIKRSELMDTLDKKIKEVEHEVHIAKALQRNDNMLCLEKIETLTHRVRACQADVLQIGKFDDKISKVQSSIIEVTDEYNQIVTERIKEVSLSFIRQVQELDLRYRESKKELSDVLVKIDKIHDFARAHDMRFE
jgi:hypothetical protein